MIVVLHNIRSLHNVGSIFRTADAAGVKKIYLCGYTPAPVDEMNRPRLPFIKASLGAEKTVSWKKIKSTSTLLKKLKKGGYKILGVEQNKKSTPYNKIKCEEKTALIMGAEIHGLPKQILTLANTILEIPMYGEKESLNVAVAFGIVAFALRGMKRCGQ